MASRTQLIADLLMGAAHADPLRKREPYEVVCRALKQVMGAGYILAAIDDRLRAFDPGVFDVSATVAELGLDDDVEKRQLLELIASLQGVDNVLVLDRDDYLRSVADALGLPEEAYADLTFDVSEARDSLLGPPPQPRTVPPPLPGSKE